MIHAIASGRADGEPIVFGHALGTDHTLWDAQAARFGTRYRVIRYDARGHGASGLPAGDAWTPADFADDLVAVLDAFDLPRAHFVGISMGALAGIVAAGRFPERFASVAVCDVHLHTAAAFTADLRARADAARTHGLAPIAEIMVGRWFAFPRRVAPDVVARLREGFATMMPSAYAASARGLADYDLRAAVRSLRVPLLLACGAHDRDLPRTYRALAADCHDATVAVIDGAGHLPNLEGADAFDAALAAFLAAHRTDCAASAGCARMASHLPADS